MFYRNSSSQKTFCIDVQSIGYLVGDFEPIPHPVKGKFLITSVGEGISTDNTLLFSPFEKSIGFITQEEKESLVLL
jgi:hypothetical protein